MTLPANENSTSGAVNWVIKEKGDVIIIPAVAVDQAYAQYDFGVFPHTPADTGFCGIILSGVAAGVATTIRETEGIQIDTDNIETGALFTTFGQVVWYDPINKLFTDTEDAGLWLVGYIIIPTNAHGVMRFEKRRYAIAGEAT